MSQIADEGISALLSLGSFTDPGLDHPWAVDVDWGDGSAHTAYSLFRIGSLGSRWHTYNDDGTYQVTVTTTDKDGGSGSATFQVMVAKCSTGLLQNGSCG